MKDRVRMSRAWRGIAIAALGVIVLCLSAGVALVATPSGAKAEPCDACPPNQDVTVAVPANVAEIEGIEERPKWIDTGVVVSVGQTICVTSSGSVQDGGGYSGGPNGDLSLCGDPSPSFPDWNECVAHLALIGRIRRFDNSLVDLDDGVAGPACPNSRPPSCGLSPTLYGPGHVGASFTGTASDAGVIELALNDGDTNNNAGGFSARVQVLQCGPTASEPMAWGRVKSLFR